MRCSYCDGFGFADFGPLGRVDCDCGTHECQAGMRALTSLMYWAAVEEGAESELRMGDFFSDKAPDRAAEAGEGWALKARADALGGAMLEAAYPTGASLPPGLEWTR